MGKYSTIYFGYKTRIYHSIVLLAEEKENAESAEWRKRANRKRAENRKDNGKCERYQNFNEAFYDESRY